MAGPLTTSTHVVMAKVPRLQSSGSENISLGDIQVIHGVSRLRPHPVTLSFELTRSSDRLKSVCNLNSI